MSGIPLPRNPTLNRPISILPLGSFWAWFSLILGTGISATLILVPGTHGEINYAFLPFSFFVATLIGSSLRDEMGCAHTCFLPGFMQGNDAHVAMIGLVGHGVLAILVTVSPQVSGVAAALQAACIIFFGGLTLFFLALRVILTLENSNWLMFIAPVLWILTSAGDEQLSALTVFLQRSAYLLPVPAFLAWWWFSNTMARPGLQRRILEVPYADPSLGGGVNIAQLEQQKQAWRDRNTQESVAVRSLTTLRLPLSAGVFRYLELIIGRSLLLVLRAEFWAVVLLMGVLKPLLGAPYGSQVLIALYPAVFLLYMLNALTLGDASPLLPVSRSQRALGLLLLNLSILLVFVFFMRFTTFIEYLFSGVAPTRGQLDWNLLTMALMLVAPVFFLCQLILGLTQRFLIGLLIVFFLIAFFCWAITIGLLSLSMPVDPGNEHIVFIVSGAGWILYLVALWWRFRHGNLCMP